MNEVTNAATATASAMGAGKAASGAAIKHTFIGMLGMSLFSAVMVMSLTMPKGKADFFASLLSTVIASLCGGAYITIKYGLLDPVFVYINSGNDSAAYFSMLPVLGVTFVCGLPVWCIVRACFVFAEKRKNQGIDVFISDARGAIK